jgi:hypothetical protein
LTSTIRGRPTSRGRNPDRDTGRRIAASGGTRHVLLHIAGMEAIVEADRIADFYDAVAALIGAPRDKNLSTTAYGAILP